jgi:putative ABC transport system permease protein
MRPEHWLYTIPLRLRSLFRRAEADKDLDDELRDHLERKTEEYVAQGMAQEEAHRRARLELEGIEQTKERCRDVRRVRGLQDLAQDVRFALRMLRKSPAFTAIAIATLAIGIGANGAIFAVTENVLLKPLPFPNSEQLVDLGHDVPGIGLHGRSAAFLYFIYREQSRSFQSVGLWRQNSNNLTGLAEPEHVRSLVLTSEVLPMIGVQPLLGRLFSAADTAPGAPLTAILAYGVWRDKFGADASVIGRNIVIDGLPRQVIGVLPRNFWFMDSKAAVLLPLQFDRSKTFLGNFMYSGIARLKPSVPLAQASADCARLIPVAARNFPPFPGLSLASFEREGITPAFTSLKASLLGDIGGVLWVLMGTIGLVLLIACANVANLMLVRTQGRQQELAIRSTLGAGWWQIARELLLESVVLGVAGGAAGAGLALAALRLLQVLHPANLPRLEQISMDARSILFTFAISVFAGLLFGLIPAIRYAGGGVAAALRTAGRGASESRQHHRARNTLVVVQVALALVLLISSGLMIRTFQALRQVQPGFSRPEEVQTFDIAIPRSVTAAPVGVTRMEQAIADRIAAIPGVSSVALTSDVPMAGGHWLDPIDVEDRTDLKATGRVYKFVSPGLLATMGNSLVAGRDFTWEDLYDQHRVTMLSENLARELWGTPQAALGKHVRHVSISPWVEVIGVVGDERADGVDQPAPEAVYWPLLMDHFDPEPLYATHDVSYVVRAPRAGSSAFMEQVSQAVWSVNKELPLANPQTLEDLYNKSLARTSFALVMLGIAGAMAFALGVAGLYGVISYSVAQRTREIGIRVALGAQNSEVRRVFVREGTLLAALGITFGSIAALGLMRLMASLLFGVKPIDPLTYAGVAVALAAAAAMASYIPARRAMRVDPMVALRHE